MAQVIVEFGPAPLADAGRSPVFIAVGHKVEEVTSSGTAASTTITANEGDIAIVTNPGTGLIWVRFDGTAAVNAGHPVAAASTREFGPLKLGATASVIDDS